MQVIKSEKGIVKAWIDGVELADNARKQLTNLADMPFIHKWVAAMPDAHFGMGATVGSVIATKGAIIPAAVGVDLGCGMIAAKLPYKAEDLPTSLKAMRDLIESRIPVGGPGVKGSWDEKGFSRPKMIDYHISSLETEYYEIIAKAPGVSRGPVAGTWSQLGTLGTGNHFIELCLDTENNVWLMLHSGSRGVGNRIASYYIEKAKIDMRKWHINLPDIDLAYIPTGSDMFGDYFAAITWAQSYAAASRSIMLHLAMMAVREAIGHNPITESYEVVANCHHNYVAAENHYDERVFVTRKGAVCARQGVLGIIPGSMGAKSFIVRGKGNPESFNSCSHGAGRVMSRTQARKSITLEQHAKATEGVECRKDDSVLDESPSAYKDIDAVMAAQSDLVEIVHTLKQVLCVKG